jgi:nitrogen fixation protein NifX
MKIAFATTDGKNIDEHFGRAGTFIIYEITDGGYQFVEVRKFAEGIDHAVMDTREKGQAHDDAVQSKVDRLADCRLIYLTELGGPSAARLIKKGIMPMKVKGPVSIENALEQLEETIKKSPPPWLRKAMEKDRSQESEFRIMKEEINHENDQGIHTAGKGTGSGIGA